jgi:hypothetical protein
MFVPPVLFVRPQRYRAQRPCTNKGQDVTGHELVTMDTMRTMGTMGTMSLEGLRFHGVLLVFIVRIVSIVPSAVALCS